MNDDARLRLLRLRIWNAVGALAVSVALLGVLGAGAGSMPALGRMLVPGHGGWDWRFTLLPVMTRPAAHMAVLDSAQLRAARTVVPRRGG